MKISDLVNKKIAVRCPRKPLAYDFVREAHEQGYVWRTVPHGEVMWDEYRDDTCYTLEKGIIQYGNFFWYADGDYQIITIDDLEEFKSPEEPDAVNHPTHYTTGDIECIDAIKSAVKDFESYCIGNAIKYLWRYRHKNGIEDLRKADFYINRVIDNQK